MVSLPDAQLHRARPSTSWSSSSVIDFFLNETRPARRRRAARLLHEEDEGTVTSAEGRVIKINKAVDCPGDARQDWQIMLDIAERLGRGEVLRPFDQPRARSSTSCGVACKGGTADYSGITYEKIDREMGVFWPCPTEDHPGTPRLFEGGQFFHPDGKAQFIPTPWRATRAKCVDDDVPVWLTTGRVVSHYLSRHPDAPHRPLVEQCPQPLPGDPPAPGGEVRPGGRRLRWRSPRGAAAWCCPPRW